MKKIGVAIIHGIGTQTDGFTTEMEEKLKKLAYETGDGEAPLCVIAHSLGTVIINDHFYDLQQGKRKEKLLENPFNERRNLNIVLYNGKPCCSLEYQL